MSETAVSPLVFGTAEVDPADALAARWLVSAAVDTPDRDLLSCFEDFDTDDRFYWEQPSASFAIAAAGSCAEIDVSGAGRFERAGEAARALFARVVRCGETATGGVAADGPLLVGGFAFEPEGAARSAVWSGFPDGRLVLPELLYVQRSGRAHCIVCTRLESDEDPGEAARRVNGRLAAALESKVGRIDATRPESHPDYRTQAETSHDAYRDRVREALDAIEAGSLQKVVLARSVRVLLDGPLAAGRLLDGLRHSHPTCTAFAVGRGDAVFLGATPEPLVAVDGEAGSVRTTAVAGSAPRGRTPSEDAALGRGLMESPKERAEHAAVVEAIRTALDGRCRLETPPAEPELLALDSIQHLATPIEGRLDASEHGRVGVLELAGALHPTPAVAGTPGPDAARWIREREGLDRGWYAAPIGYVDARGGGELRVALRSALVRGGIARLYAGAGIVAGSNPEAELRETRLKLGTLLGPLLEV